MKLIIQNNRVVGTATDDYAGSEQIITAPPDFDISKLALYTVSNGALSTVQATDWLIDVGPFFDRFATAKMPLLMSTNATVQALVKDLQVRKWIDLQRADVAAGIDALIALGVTNMTAALKTAILTAPVTAEENFALRKTYFHN